MAHQQQLNYVQMVHDLYIAKHAHMRILEIGAYDVNGSIRRIFGQDVQYVGIDLIKGPGVDIVCSGEEVDLEDNSFDVVLSCECFEHNPKWVATFQNMIRMLKPNGFALVTCASTGRPEHGTSRTDPSLSPGTSSLGSDYYQNLTRRDFKRNLDLEHLFSHYQFFYNRRHKDLYFIGVKRSSHPVVADLISINRAYELESRRFLASQNKMYVRAAALYDWSVKQAELLLPDALFQLYVAWSEKLISRAIS